MAGTWSRVKTWSAAETLTAADLNAEFDNVLAESDPDGIDDASTDAAAMNTTADPYPAAASLATNLREEIHRLRYVIKQITGEAQWYIDPDFAISDVTATATELNLNDNIWASVTTSFVDGTDGTGTAQFTFKDAAGTTMATPVAGHAYISEVATGLTVDLLDDDLLVATNGVITLSEATVYSNFNYVTSAAGLLGIDLQGDADSYWVVFVHPTGKLVISDECAVTGG